MDILDPRSYADDPSRYPLTPNDLDFVAAFEPENERGLTSMADRIAELVVFGEAIVRAAKRRLDADRAAALARCNDRDQAPDWTPSQMLFRRCLPSGQP